MKAKVKVDPLRVRLEVTTKIADLLENFPTSPVRVKLGDSI